MTDLEIETREQNLIHFQTEQILLANPLGPDCPLNVADEIFARAFPYGDVAKNILIGFMRNRSHG